MPTVRFVLPLFFMVGCVPQNASLTSGSFITFLSDSSSPSLATGDVDPDNEAWRQDGYSSFNIDCREFENREERLQNQLANPINICGDEWPPVHEAWAVRDGYRTVAGPLDAYRGEAVANAEGDIQLAFHHRLPDGEDFRFVFAIDPDFQPTVCVADESGGVTREQLGGDWVENWSREVRSLAGGDGVPAGFEHLAGLLDGGRLYFINSNAYQFNPDWWTTITEADDRWFLPNQWLSGAATGRFSEDLLNQRASRYGEPSYYELYETTEPGFDARDGVNSDAAALERVWHCPDPLLEAGEDPTENPCMEALQERLDVVADETSEEMRTFALGNGTGANAEPVFTYRPIVHVNDWLDSDGSFPGIDAWGQIEYSFVVFSADSQLEVGGSARGAFQILFEGIGSTSRSIVKGTFEVDKIREDRWGAGDLFAERAEQSEVTLCFEQ